MCKNNVFFRKIHEYFTKKAYYSLKKRCFHQFIHLFIVFLQLLNAN